MSDTMKQKLGPYINPDILPVWEELTIPKTLSKYYIFLILFKTTQARPRQLNLLFYRSTCLDLYV